MTILLLVALLLAYGCGMFLPLCFPNRPHIQNVMAHGSAAVASGFGIALGLIGLLAAEPLVISLPSSIPLLAFSLLLDSLAGFFVLTISLVGLAVSVFANGYVRDFYGRIPVSLLGLLYNGFLLSMVLVVMADNAFFFLIVWELMSLLSYFLVVSEHEKSDVRFAGLFYLIMTHVGTAFIVVTFLMFYQETGSFAFESFRSGEQTLPEGLRTARRGAENLPSQM